MDSLCILLISDTHHKIDQLQALEDYIVSNKLIYDIIIHSGDFGNITYEKSKLPTLEEEESNKEEVHYCLKLLSKYSKDSKVYFIPGNHDSQIFHMGNDIFDEQFVNLNGKVVDLGKNIHLVGLGGSMPSVYLNDLPEVGNDKFISKGYPFTSPTFKQAEKMYHESVIKLVSNESIKNYILVNHSGLYANTSTKYKEGEYHVMGSKDVFNSIANDSRLIFGINGHFHLSQGKMNIGFDKSIVNPGGIIFGLFAEITLIPDELGWKMKKIAFRSLNHC